MLEVDLVRVVHEGQETAKECVIFGEVVGGEVTTRGLRKKVGGVSSKSFQSFRYQDQI